MQVQKNIYNPNFGMAIKMTPAAKKYVERQSARHSLEQLKILIKEQKKNPFDVEISYVERRNLSSHNNNYYDFCAKVGSIIQKQREKQTPMNFILSAVNYANELNAKFSKVVK